jgi:hypothetical protein
MMKLSIRDVPASEILFLLHFFEVEGKLDAMPYWFSTSVLSTQNYNSHSTYRQPLFGSSVTDNGECA